MKRSCKHARLEFEKLPRGLMLWRCLRCHAEIPLNEREIGAYAHGEVNGAAAAKSELRYWLGCSR